MRSIRTRALFFILGTAAAIVVMQLGTHERAAHANAPSGRYTTGLEGSIPVVTDSQTGLVWKESEETGTFAWAAAKSKCTSPWRLPTLGELFSILDETRTTMPAIDPTFFPGASSTPVWSSSSFAPDGTYAWFVDFGNYGVSYTFATNANPVRCVH